MDYLRPARRSVCLRLEGIFAQTVNLKHWNGCLNFHNFTRKAPVYVRHIEFCRKNDEIRYAFFYLRFDWFTAHWHPSIAAYP